MEIGAFFILAILVIVLFILGGGVYAIAMWLRHERLDPEGDKLKGSVEPSEDAEDPRPEHIEHGNAQRARFVGGR
jgi:hypothetical protein